MVYRTQILSILIFVAFFHSTEVMIAGSVKIYPFEISQETVDFEKVDVGKSRARKISFTNTLNETVVLEKIILLQNFVLATQQITFPLKFQPKETKEFEFTYSPKKPEILSSVLKFVYSVINQTMQESSDGIPFNAIGWGVLLKQNELSFGEVAIGDTVKKELLLSNDGTKEAEYKISKITVSDPTSFQCLAKIGDVVTVAPGKTFSVPFLFHPQVAGKLSAKCTLTRSDNSSVIGYEALSNLIVSGFGKIKPFISTVNIESSVRVAIGDTAILPLQITIVNKPKEYVSLVLSGTLEYHDGIIAILPIMKGNTEATFSTDIVNGQRRVVWKVSLPSRDNEQTITLPFTIVGTLGETDTTKVRFSITDCTIDDIPVRLEARDVQTDITVTGYLEYKNRKRTILAQGLGDVRISMDDVIVRDECIMQFEGLTQQASLRIYDGSGAIIGSFIVPQFVSPTISIPKNFFSYGTYTAVLWYGSEFSTVRFIVLP